MTELESLNTQEFTAGDGVYLGAKETWSYLTRRMYQRRNSFDPLWNQLVIAGCRDNKPFLGFVDLHGTSYEDVTIATGYGAHLARPILRNAIDEYGNSMTREQAFSVVESCMKILFYRDCRTINKFQIAKVTKDGPVTSPPYSLATKWDYELFVNPDKS